MLNITNTKMSENVCDDGADSDPVNVCRDCEANEPLWTALHLYKVVNLDDLLNVTKVSLLTNKPGPTRRAHSANNHF